MLAKADSRVAIAKRQGAPRARRASVPVLIALTLWAPATTCAQAVTGEQVRQAISSATNYLLAQQIWDGRWDEYPGYSGGSSAIATLALIHAGVPLNDERMRNALVMTRAIPNKQTYVVALKAQALAAADPEQYRQDIDSAARWLVSAQKDNGMWGYTDGDRQVDFSNSQFALLGLHAAAQAGAAVPRTCWRKAEQAWTSAQRTDGSWGYLPQAGAGTGSMTAAGVASLFITGNSLSEPIRPAAVGLEIPCCGRYGSFRPINAGLNWLAGNFSVVRNPASGHWLYYYLYALERVGIMSGQQNIGRHDWYREGATRLIQTQRPDGSWQDTHPIVDTAFGLLFLAKGHRPVLIHKLRWSTDSRWNVARNDLEHLVGFIGDRLGQPVGWEAIDHKADLANWLRAPMLYISGKSLPALPEETVDKIRAYVREGGTVLAAACCGQRTFLDDFTQLAQQAFPEHELDRLAPDHPIFHSLFGLDGKEFEVYGLTAGCRTSVIVSITDLACAWEFGNLPITSERLFQLGTNIAAYATGLEPLPDKLDAVRLVQRADPSAETQPATDALRRGALHIAQLMHHGDWRPNPQALPNLLANLREQGGVDVFAQPAALKADDPLLAEHPVVYMAGHYSFSLSDTEKAGLKRHLQRGGFLLANACCGREAFDRSFRELMAELFPDQPLERLGAQHPILIGKPGRPVTQVTYRASMRAEHPGLQAPWLEGLSLDGRLAVVYSPLSLDCGLDGHACFACRGLSPPDALHLAANVILYALSH